MGCDDAVSASALLARGMSMAEVAELQTEDFELAMSAVIKANLPASVVSDIVQAWPQGDLDKSVQATIKVHQAFCCPSMFPKSDVINAMAQVRVAQSGSLFALRYLPFGFQKSASRRSTHRRPYVTKCWNRNSFAHWNGLAL